MASTPAPPNKDEEVNNPPSSASYYQKTVCLQDWWLIKAEKDFQGRTIAVAGTSREKFAVRMFSSAPILKTYDLHILETVDGVTVILKGFINKERTKENGFSSEVFKHFVIGFPANWKRYAEGGFVGGSSIKHTSKMVEGSSVEDSTDRSLASDKLSTDSESVDDSHEAASARKESNFTQPEVGVANTMADKTQEQMSGNKASQASKPSKRTRQTLKSSIEVSDVSQKNKQNVADKETTAKDSGRSKKKTKRELIYESPLVQEKAVDTSSNSTESLSFKRSRSGRLLVPTLEFWRNQRVVYDGKNTSGAPSVEHQAREQENQHDSRSAS